MDSRETKRTVPIPSVGADGEQPNSQKPTMSIAEEPAENKSQDESMEDILRELQRTSDPAYLHTVSMRLSSVSADDKMKENAEEKM